MRTSTLFAAAGAAGALALGSLSLGTAAVAAVPGTAGPAVDVVPEQTGTGALEHVTSRNWTGYASLPKGRTSTFTFLRSTWVQPKVTCPTSDAWAVFWVGLDGYSDGTVEQGGSSARCVGGVPHYQTWWETFPANSIQLVNTIAAGDTITATVSYSPSTRKYTIVVKDDTTGKSFTKVTACPSGSTCRRTSSEVIAEDVGKGNNQFFPLAKYDPVTFKNTQETNQGGTAGAFASGAWQNSEITEAADGVTYATSGPLSNGGKNFTSTWHHK